MALTRLVRWQLGIFAVVTVLAITSVSLFYLRLPSALGFGSYDVTANFPSSGGLYENANVTYLSVAKLRSPLVARKSPHLLAGVEVSSVAFTSLVVGVAHAERLPVGDDDAGVM